MGNRRRMRRAPSAADPQARTAADGFRSAPRSDPGRRDRARQVRRVVRGLTAADFALRRTASRSGSQNFTFQEIRTRRRRRIATADLLAGVEAKLKARRDQPAPAAPRQNPRRRRADVGCAGRAAPDGAVVRRQLDAARRRAARRRLGAEVRQRADGDGRPRRGRHRRLDAHRAHRLHRRAQGGARRSPSSPTPRARPTTAARRTPRRPTRRRGAEDDATETSELDMFNNDVRLRALKTWRKRWRRSSRRRRSSTSAPACSGAGGQPGRAARCDQRRGARQRGDLSGRYAWAAGGRARRRRGQASGRGNDMFSGRGMRAAVPAAHRSQDTLTTLAADTGGRAFTDTNDSAMRSRACSATCRPTTCSATAAATRRKDGRFRRMQVRGQARRPATSTRAPAITPSAISRTPTAAIAKRSSRSSSTRRCRRPTCRARHRRLLPAQRDQLLRADRGGHPRIRRAGRPKRTRSRSTSWAWFATSRGGRSAGSARR